MGDSSAGCCPYGCDEILIRTAALEKLEELEDAAEEAAREANKELIEAREVVNYQASDGNVVQNVRARRSRQLSLLNEEVESSSDESSSSNDESSSFNDEETGEHFSEIDKKPPLSGNSAIRQRYATSVDKKWLQANRNLRRTGGLRRRNAVKLRRKIPSGRWYVPSFQSYFQRGGRAAKRTIRQAAKRTVKRATYAVVTFTSRQAAIAARQCLADGVGRDCWTEVEDIPVPPLADGPSWNILFGRGICKPVTITLNENEKKCRQKT
jgi:hypothetical protein